MQKIGKSFVEKDFFCKPAKCTIHILKLTFGDDEAIFQHVTYVYIAPWQYSLTGQCRIIEKLKLQAVIFLECHFETTIYIHDIVQARTYSKGEAARHF